MKMTKDECFCDNCKLSKDPSGIANSAQRSTINLLHIQSNREVCGSRGNCLLKKDFMIKRHIIFKKIPRDITRF